MGVHRSARAVALGHTPGKIVTKCCTRRVDNEAKLALVDVLEYRFPESCNRKVGSVSMQRLTKRPGA